MTFKFTESAPASEPEAATFKASVADLKRQARTVPGFGRGVAVGFLSGLVIGATALGWLSPYLQLW